LRKEYGGMGVRRLYCFVGEMVLEVVSREGWVVAEGVGG